MTFRYPIPMLIGLVIAMCAGAVAMAAVEDDETAADDTAEAAPSFEADSRLGEYAATAAEQAREFAQGEYAAPLSWKSESIEELDRIAQRLHEAYVREEPSDAEIVPVVRSLGSYLGELYRRNYGGEWGWVIEGEGEDALRNPGIKNDAGDLLLPWARVLARIKSGAEYNLTEYFESLQEEEAE